MDKALFYDSIAKEFDSIMNQYDTQKRVSVVFDEFLPLNLKGKRLLDAGCGTGWFSAQAADRGAVVTSIDVGIKLLHEVRKKCQATVVVGSVLNLPFKNKSFDIVVSSEVIEHTANPLSAVVEMARVVKQGGVLIITTPNKFWYWSLVIATVFKLRKYQGIENWISWNQLLQVLHNSKLEILHRKGIHAFPFMFRSTHPLLDYLHAQNRFLWPFMVNMAVKCKKQ